jgi:ParB-like nuclease domain
MPTPSSAIEPVKREHQIERWPIDRLVFYARNPRKNDSVVHRMCSSIREFGFKVPVLARSDGEVVDGHLRLKAALKSSPKCRSSSVTNGQQRRSKLFGSW